MSCERMPPGEDKREQLARHLSAWERHGVRFGLHAESRALAKHANLFRTVCLTFPTPPPQGVEHIMMVSSEFTTYRFSCSHFDRSLRDQRNPRFLSADALQAWLGSVPSVPAIVLLRIGHVYRTEEVRSGRFLDMLRRCLDQLPEGRTYAVELANGEFLLPQYFECLRERGVIHVPRIHRNMPPLVDQILQPGFITADRCVLVVDADLTPQLPLGIAETVRRCLEERKGLAVYLPDTDVAYHMLERLMAMLDQDLAQLSPIKQKRAA